MWGKPFFFYQKAKIIERIHSSFQIQLKWTLLKGFEETTVNQAEKLSHALWIPSQSFLGPVINPIKPSRCYKKTML